MTGHEEPCPGFAQTTNKGSPAAPVTGQMAAKGPQTFHGGTGGEAGRGVGYPGF